MKAAVFALATLCTLSHHRGTASTPAAVFGRSTSCAQDCPTPSNFQYASNMVHVFDYHASAKFLSGSREPQLGVAARAHITVAGPCEMILALSHVRLADSSDSSPDFGAALVLNPLRFGFQDGRVSSLCPAQDEPRWVLNVKRAVLSTFQVSMGDLNSTTPVVVEETDVSGTCTSTYTSVIEEPGLVNVTRKRSEACIAPAAPPTPCYKTRLLQMLPLFNREQKCLQMISGGTLKEAICRENFRYPELLADEEDSLVASLTSSLKLVYQFKADFVVVPNYDTTRCSLELEWEDSSEEQPPEDWLPLVSQIISRMQQIAPEPSLFYSLIKIVKTLSYENISQMFLGISPKLWETAAMSLLRLGTEPSMKFVVDLLKSDAIPYDSYNSVKDIVEYLLKHYEVNSPMIDIMQHRLRQYNYDSDMIKTKLKGYCQQHPQCTDDPRIEKMISDILRLDQSPQCIDDTNSTLPLEEETEAYDEYFTTITPNDIFASNPSDDGNFTSLSYFSFESPRPLYVAEYNSGERKSVYYNTKILQSWSNLGRWNRTFTPDLDECVVSTEAEERFVALQTLRSSPCDMYDYENLLLFAKNINETDTYQQIMTYQTLIRCPTQNLKIFLAAKLKDDSVNQATSYIWTHLLNCNNVAWTKEIVENKELQSKFITSALKFSRNYRKVFVVSNESYSVEFNIIFSGFSLMPQYMSLKISSQTFEPLNLLEIERRVKNITQKDSYNEYLQNEIIDSTCVLTVNALGNTIYSKESPMDYSIFSFEPEDIYGPAILFGFGLISHVSYESIVRWFLNYGYTTEYRKGMDIRLQYPTSIGMPFYLNLNKTVGIHRNNLFSFYAKQFDALMLIDATYTNVGTKLVATWDVFPSLNVTRLDEGFGVVIDLPEEKTKLIDFDYGVYNVENNRLTPRFDRNSSEMESMCLPGLKKITGSTFCLQYCPKSKWWPLYNLKYSLVYSRDNRVRGYNITTRFGESFFDVGYEVLNVPEETAKIKMYYLAQFVNVEMVTPYFSLNGSGTFQPRVLRFRDTGSAVNISGIFSCNNETAPFVLTSETSFKNNSEKTSVMVNFYSSILDVDILSRFECGKNSTFDIQIPYKIKGKTRESVRVVATRHKYSLTSRDRSNYVTETETNFTRRIYSTSVAFSQYPDTMLAIEGVCEDSDGINDTDTYVANLELSCSNHSLTTSISVLNERKRSDYNCSIQYQKPNKKITWNKSISLGKETKCMKSSMTCDGELVYEAEGHFSAGILKGLYGNASLLVPLREPDPKYPLLNITLEKNLDFFKQHFHVLCLKSYRDKSLKLNVSADVLTDDKGIPLGFGESLQHKGVFEITCNKKDPFLVLAKSKLSTALDELDLSVDVQTPFKRWNKEAFNLKLEMKKNHLRTKVTENRKEKDPSTYVLEGSMDHDIVTNLLDFGTDQILKHGLPEKKKQ